MSQKLQKIYRTLMLILLTSAITFIITSTAMYNISGKENTKNIPTINLLQRKVASYNLPIMEFREFLFFRLAV